MREKTSGKRLLKDVQNQGTAAAHQRSGRAARWGALSSERRQTQGKEECRKKNNGMMTFKRRERKGE